uniref:uncharacterized protein LOC122772982 isoform X2 n=1 Tax=Solea senegalensis TaxID=28829 RepID=UPI001CD83E45|nr:uncharacterized protein LOC122772982 isoform X2 [Solea senegalensis]
MCSVDGCESWHRNAQRFKLPEDPEMRLEWVQFLATVNKQRFKESSWTEITICAEHFKRDCLIYVAPTGAVQLTPGAVPSLCVQSKPEWLSVSVCLRPRSEHRKEKDRQRKRKALENETPEQAELRKIKNRERMAERRKQETEKQRYERLSKVRSKVAETRAKETPDAQAARLSKVRRKVAETRAKETPDARAARLFKDRSKTAETRIKETPDARAARLSKDRSKTAETRAKEAPDERAIRLSANRRRTAKTHAAETPEQRSTRLSRDTMAKLKTANALTTEDASRAFSERIKEGPTCVCCVCHRLMYRKTVVRFNQDKYNKFSKDVTTELTNHLSTDCTWICNTCDSTMKTGQMPAQAKANGLHLSDIPEELSDLRPLEWQDGDHDLWQAINQSPCARTDEVSTVTVPQAARTDIYSIAKRYGYDVEDVPSDGNCFFNAIHVTCARSNIDCVSPDELRQALVRFLRTSNDVDRYQQFIPDPIASHEAIVAGYDVDMPEDIDFGIACIPDVVDRQIETWNRYVDRLEKGAWADNVTVQALSDMMDMEIHIVTTINPDAMTIVKPPDDSPSRRVVTIGLIDQCHYVALRLTEANQSTSKPAQVDQSSSAQTDQSTVPLMSKQEREDAEDDRAFEETAAARGLPYSTCVQEDNPQDHDNEPVETTEVKTYSPSFHEESRLPAREGPVPLSVLCSTRDVSDTSVSEMLPKNVNIDLILKRAAPVQTKEKHLLKLFNEKCQSCGCKLRIDKVTHGGLVVFNQQCLQCVHRNQRKSQAGPTEDSFVSHVGVNEVTDSVNKTEGSRDETEVDSERKTSVPQVISDKETDNDEESEDNEESEDDDEESEDDDEAERTCYNLAPQPNELCTVCGKFYRKRWPHTCEHILKPYSCNICGKRCANEHAVNSHSRVHEVNYAHRCKYCHMTFKTKVGKVNHEQIHQTEGQPYKCSECSEAFATNKERSLHMEDHTGPKQLKCHICGKEFLWTLALQRHLNVHTGLRPHKCSVCHRGFNQPSHLKSHMRLHTGERPYKCQHCDKCFNHNVSLKSHVQRYHTPGNERNNAKRKKRNTSDAQGVGNKMGEDSVLATVEKIQDAQLSEQERKKKRHTGRPIGRPKSYASSNVVLEIQLEDPSSQINTEDPQAVSTLTDNNGTISELAGEGGQKSTDTKDTTKSRRKKTHFDSDSEFDPDETKKKRSGKCPGKQRGRPRKTPVV